VAVPRGEAGTALRERLAQSLAGAPAFVQGTADDIVLLWEAAPLPAAHVAASLIGPLQGQADLVRHVMTRTDVAWSPFVVVAAG
jgi:hypothetical protein